MKKSYLLLVTMIAGGMSFAQSNLSPMMGKTKSMKEVRPVSNNTILNRAEGDLIGTVMDFTTPADWVIANTGTPSADWVIGSAAPTGTYSASYGTLASTSAGNFAMFDSDALGNATSTQDATITMANSVVMTGFNNVLFSFESLYSHYSGECYVEISNNGTDWTQYQVHEDVEGNEASDNPTLVEVNISAVAANQATVWARFRYVGTWDYAWMIDDAKFTEGYDNELIVGSTYFGPFGSWEEHMPYYSVPSAQISPIHFGAIINNEGGVDQTTVGLTVDVNNGASSLTSASTVDITTYNSDSLFTETITPSGVGSTYDFKMYTGSADFTDSNPINDTVTFETVTVTDYLYARDNGTRDNASFNSGDAFEVGNVFDMFANQEVWGINVTIHPSSEANGGVNPTIKVILYEVDLATGDFNFIDESDEYLLSASNMAGGEVTLKLQDSYMMEANKTYLAVVATEGNGGTNNDLVVGTAGSSKRSTSYFKDEAGTWFYTTNTPMVRLNFDPVLGVEASNELASNVNAYPNPATDNVNITYSVSQESNVAVSVVSVTGKVVYSNNVGNVAAGKYNENINSSEFANGVYFYTLTVNGEETTKKLIISNK